MSVTINERGYVSTITDGTWFAELRSSMRHAFGCHPALASMFLQAKIDKKAGCKHLYQNGEDGPCCIKCSDHRWGPDGEQP